MTLPSPAEPATVTCHDCGREVPWRQSVWRHGPGGAYDLCLPCWAASRTPNHPSAFPPESPRSPAAS